jgi:DNA-binding CsgD family transcriptional regulator
MVSQAKEDAVIAAVRRLSCAGLDTEQLHRVVIDQIRRLIPIDGYCAHDLDPASGLPMRLYFDVPDDRPVRDLVAMIVFGENSPDSRSLAMTGHLVQRLSETTGGQLERSFHYREVLAPLGFGDDLRGVYAWHGQPWGGVSMLRERGQRDFSDEAVTLLGRLTPHIAAGLRASLLRSTAADARATPETAGVIVLDDAGRVASFTLAAEHWLSELETLRPDWHEQAALPTAVWMAVATLRRIVRPQTERDRRLTPTIQAPARSGGWVHIQVSLALPANGHDGDMIIVIGPAAPSTVQWLRTSVYQLSPREGEIVALVARGASTRQIAHSLYISEYTVQDHLKHIFEKVGVHTRRALVKQLYLASF